MARTAAAAQIEYASAPFPWMRGSKERRARMSARTSGAAITLESYCVGGVVVAVRRFPGRGVRALADE
jgi:hypothetical protein